MLMDQRINLPTKHGYACPVTPAVQNVTDLALITAQDADKTSCFSPPTQCVFQAVRMVTQLIKLQENVKLALVSATHVK